MQHTTTNPPSTTETEETVTFCVHILIHGSMTTTEIPLMTTCDDADNDDDGCDGRRWLLLLRELLERSEKQVHVSRPMMVT
ncbi:hypothetical protein ACLKA7_015685 [Drosophila subpalustris]